MEEPRWNFDIDTYLNRFVPANRLYRLPTAISWFLGYRQHPRPRIGSVVECFWAFLGAFLGLLAVEAVFQSPVLKSDGAPVVLASFVCFQLTAFGAVGLEVKRLNQTKGAAAILEYNAITSPLAQPRPAILGQLISATIGVAITKLFLLSPHFLSVRWVAGALSVGAASAIMGFTKTVHPPAGATALLCATDPLIVELGWSILPLVLLGTVLMLGVAFLVNNIQRSFPAFWWTPEPLSSPPNLDLEESGLNNESAWKQIEGKREVLVVSEDGIVAPRWLELDMEDKFLLERLRGRLKDGLNRSKSESTRMNDAEPRQGSAALSNVSSE